MCDEKRKVQRHLINQSAHMRLGRSDIVRIRVADISILGAGFYSDMPLTRQTCGELQMWLLAPNSTLFRTQFVVMNVALVGGKGYRAGVEFVHTPADMRTVIHAFVRLRAQLPLNSLVV